ncbi:MAG: tyrosine-type recombinase/integrase [Devosia nanyangense]|uniref:Tyrosine-type recombinase/integrase n=1 Tax=Devosia nanyangense TaxID=1228055 RepID=A0A933L4M0_9HYPH|nr:tyrosine-type recombinase/integrase [Devosia nanyangense]
MPFLIAAKTYLDFIAHVRRLSAHSVAAYRSDLSCFAARYPGAPAELTMGMLTEHVIWLTRERGLAAASVRRHAASLRSFVRYAVEQKLCEPALAAWRPQLKRPRRLPRPVSRVEMRQLVATSGRAGDLVVTAILLMAGTGLRISELCALRVGDVEPDARSILILGKGARERVVYVANANLRDRLRSLMARKSDGGAPIDSSSPLFYARDHRSLSAAALRRQIRAHAKRTGLVRPVSPHMFRHSAATWLIEEGIDIRTVQRLLGHASIATTEIYTHVADRLLEQSLKRVDVLRRVAG